MWRIYLFFHVRRSERKRLLVVFALPVVLMMTGMIWNSYNSVEGKWDEKIAYWQSSIVELKRQQAEQMHAAAKSFVAEGYFDPDTMQMESWMRSGLPYRQAQTLMRYTDAGGRLDDAADLGRMNAGDSIWQRTVASAIVPRNRNMRYTPRYSNPYFQKQGFDLHRVMFKLDPNATNKVELIRTGLPEWMAERWLKYREAGGGFHSAEDLASLYGMDTNWLDRWKDSLIFPQPEEVHITGFTADINAMDSASWSRLPGIAPWTSRNIVRYRNKLGGFYSKKQLFEVRGIDSSAIQSLMPDIHLESKVRNSIKLNTMTLEQLAHHPYISWKQAEVIVFYRSRVRPIESATDLIGLEGWTSTDVERIVPYVSK